eukprot:gene57431-biopygen50799
MIVASKDKGFLERSSPALGMWGQHNASPAHGGNEAAARSGRGDACFGLRVSSSIADQLQMVAKLMKVRSSLGRQRDAFFVATGGFDTHHDLHNTLTSNMKEIDDAIANFKEEMVAQTIWENVVLLSTSDFGRTLTTNGEGTHSDRFSSRLFGHSFRLHFFPIPHLLAATVCTDHAWAGNHFVVGGGVKGGRFHGVYPDVLTEDGPQVLGRGRVLPTTSWEMVWDPIAKWYGIEAGRLDTVLPNRQDFPGLIPENDFFG